MLRTFCHCRFRERSPEFCSWLLAGLGGEGFLVGRAVRIGVADHAGERERVDGLAEDGVQVGVFVPADVVQNEVSLPADGQFSRSGLETDLHFVARSK